MAVDNASSDNDEAAPDEGSMMPIPSNRMLHIIAKDMMHGETLFMILYLCVYAVRRRERID